MKTLIIVILAAALVGAAYFTRPSRDSFDSMVKAQAEAQGGTFATSMINGVKADSFLNSVQFNDRYMFTSVAKDGQTLYVGAFGHWFERGKVIEVTPQKVDTIHVKLPV